MPKLLVIEDNPDFAELIVQAADKLGWEVEQATFGEEALREIAVLEPDVVTLDWKLPDQTGEGVLHWIKTHWPQATIVVISAYANEPPVRQAAQANGAWRIVAKPLKLTEIKRLLQEAWDA